MLVKIDGKEIEVRKINLSDYDAVRGKLRREKISAVTNMQSAEVLAKVIAAPITNKEISEYMDSIVGIAWLFSRCCNDKIKKEVVDKMVMAWDKTIIEWLADETAKNSPKPTD